MAVAHRRQQTVFSTVHSEGANLPMDLLLRIVQNDPPIAGRTPDAYHLSVEKLNEAINHAWNRVLSTWLTFKAAQTKLSEENPGTSLTRERWLLPLFNELGYGRLLMAKPIEVNDRSYPISHSWQHTPIHLVGCNVKLDQATKGGTGALRSSPHSLLQELLNRSDNHLWGIVSNGLCLRILRDNVSITRQAYVEFDLESMMNGEVYTDFVLLWLLCHQSRVEAERPEECWLEKWSRMAHEQGIRVLDQLRVGVEKAITDLGSGFLAHHANGSLHEKLRTGQLSTQDYYRQILRLVYRLLVLFVAEDRDILFHPDAPQLVRDLYTKYYSTAHLRYLAEQHIGTRHADLFHCLCLVMDKLGQDSGCPELGLPALNGFLFSQAAIVDLVGCEIANHYLLAAIRSLAFTSSRHTRRVVDYKNLGSEELGSVYESLLELHPVLHIEIAKFELATASGNERKTTGSYYTPTSLITSLLDSALDPVLNEACAQPDPEKAILNLKICDPACGSGHFLVAAAHRIAKCLAAIRTNEEEPAPEARRKALRDVIGRCIYGVDINPMSVEICKVSLWMEAIEPGKPLSFLDAHIQCGNSLLGATPALLKQGIPDSAFEPIEGDDKSYCSSYKKLNKKYRDGNRTLPLEEGQTWENIRGNLVARMIQMESISDSTVKGIHGKQEQYDQLMNSRDYLSERLLADAWCAAFVWKKTKESVSPITEEVFRAIETNPRSISPQIEEEIRRLAKQYLFFHWHLVFPDVFCISNEGEMPENRQTGWSGGFDVVLGNPPWERIKIQEKEWFASRRPDIANAVNAAQRRKMIATLVHEAPELHKAFMQDQRQAMGESHIIRDSSRYPLCGRGDVNTYAVFAENMRLVVNFHGRVGCIVPSGIATDDTTKFFFQNLMETQSLASLYSFENEAKLFPGIDHRVKFALLTITGSSVPIKNAEFAFSIYRTEELKEEERHFSLSAADIVLLNPNTRTCPIFRSKRDMKLTKAIYKKIPVLQKEGPPGENPWEIKFFTMFHMANDSHLFHSREQLERDGWILTGNILYKENERYFPLYEAKMISLFNHRFGTYEGATKEELARGKLPELNTQQLEQDNYYPIPNYWVAETEIERVYQKTTQWLFCFRNITSASVLRTFIGTIIPRVASGHSLNFMLSNSVESTKLLCLLANLSSFIEDYVIRQKVGGNNLSFFIIRQLPFLCPEQYPKACSWSMHEVLIDWISKRALELTYTAWDLEPFAKDCGYDGPPFCWDEERRFLLRCELDAAYFHLYGIAHDDVDYIMDTFRVWREKEEKQYCEYRTKRVILEIYDEMQKAIETGKPYQTRLDPSPADPSVAHAPRQIEGLK